MANGLLFRTATDAIALLDHMDFAAVRLTSNTNARDAAVPVDRVNLIRSENCIDGSSEADLGMALRTRTLQWRVSER